MPTHEDFLLKSYYFDLPEEKIAQEPANKRDQSKLLVYSQKEGTIQHSSFQNILDFLPQSRDGKKALLVANNSKVVPARLFGTSPHGGKRELLLLTPPIFLEEEAQKNAKKNTCMRSAEAEVLLKPSKNAKINDIWTFGEHLQVEILEKFDFGKTRVRLSWDTAKSSIIDFFEKEGHLPLPPYIRRTLNSENDKKRYQTIYANSDKAGSVAAPTAGLHFTPQLKEELLAKGFLWEEVTLHVGYGTFTPVRENDIRNHPMHSEYFELSKKTAQNILQAKEEGRPIIAVGTTSCRVLEGAAQLWHNSLENSSQTLLPANGMTDKTKIFIYPQSAHKPCIVDGIITNFHLPESSLLMLVSALVSRKEILRVYQEAIEEDYRFFSYGDAMLIS